MPRRRDDGGDPFLSPLFAEYGNAFSTDDYANDVNLTLTTIGHTSNPLFPPPANPYHFPSNDVSSTRFPLPPPALPYSQLSTPYPAPAPPSASTSGSSSTVLPEPSLSQLEAEQRALEDQLAAKSAQVAESTRRKRGGMSYEEALAQVAKQYGQAPPILPTTGRSKHQSRRGTTIPPASNYDDDDDDDKVIVEDLRPRRIPSYSLASDSPNHLNNRPIPPRAPSSTTRPSYLPDSYQWTRSEFDEAQGSTENPALHIMAVNPETFEVASKEEFASISTAMSDRLRAMREAIKSWPTLANVPANKLSFKKVTDNPPLFDYLQNMLAADPVVGPWFQPSQGDWKYREFIRGASRSREFIRRAAARIRDAGLSNRPSNKKTIKREELDFDEDDDEDKLLPPARSSKRAPPPSPCGPRASKIAKSDKTSTATSRSRSRVPVFDDHDSDDNDTETSPRSLEQRCREERKGKGRMVEEGIKRKGGQDRRNAENTFTSSKPGVSSGDSHPPKPPQNPLKPSTSFAPRSTSAPHPRPRLSTSNNSSTPLAFQPPKPAQVSSNDHSPFPQSTITRTVSAPTCTTAHRGFVTEKRMVAEAAKRGRIEEEDIKPLTTVGRVNSKRSEKPVESITVDSDSELDAIEAASSPNPPPRTPHPKHAMASSIISADTPPSIFKEPRAFLEDDAVDQLIEHELALACEPARSSIHNLFKFINDYSDLEEQPAPNSKFDFVIEVMMSAVYDKEYLYTFNQWPETTGQLFGAFFFDEHSEFTDAVKSNITPQAARDFARSLVNLIKTGFEHMRTVFATPFILGSRSLTLADGTVRDLACLQSDDTELLTSLAELLPGAIRTVALNLEKSWTKIVVPPKKAPRDKNQAKDRTENSAIDPENDDGNQELDNDHQPKIDKRKRKPKVSSNLPPSAASPSPFTDNDADHEYDDEATSAGNEASTLPASTSAHPAVPKTRARLSRRGNNTGVSQANFLAAWRSFIDWFNLDDAESRRVAVKDLRRWAPIAVRECAGMTLKAEILEALDDFIDKHAFTPDNPPDPDLTDSLPL